MQIHQASQGLTIHINLLGKSVWIQECLKTQSGEDSPSSGRFNPVGRLQQSGCLGSYPP